MFILTAVYPTSRISTCLCVNCNLQVADYRILFDDDRYPASGCSLIKSGDRLLITVQRASDAERGIFSLLTQSDDLGATWTEPRPFGPPLAHPETEFQGVGPAHVLDDGTVVACGIYLPKGFDRASGGRGLYRPSDILIGHRAPGADQFSWRRIAAGWCSPCGDRPRAATTGSAACCSQTTAAARSATGRSATSRIRRSARTREVTPVSTTVGERTPIPRPVADDRRIDGDPARLVTHRRTIRQRVICKRRISLSGLFLARS